MREGELVWGGLPQRSREDEDEAEEEEPTTAAATITTATAEKQQQSSSPKPSRSLAPDSRKGVNADGGRSGATAVAASATGGGRVKTDHNPFALLVLEGSVTAVFRDGEHGGDGGKEKTTKMREQELGPGRWNIRCCLPFVVIFFVCFPSYRQSESYVLRGKVNLVQGIELYKTCKM